MASDPRVRIEHATVRYGGADVLRDVSLTCCAGELACTRGPNGAGKTTLLRLLAGVLRPSAGTRIAPGPCAYVPASMSPPTLSARRWLHGVRPRRASDPLLALEQLGFDGELGRGCRALSFGNLRKVLLADALSSSATLVVIDEALSGLDARGHEGLAALITASRSRGAAVVVAVQEGQEIAGADVDLLAGNGTIRREAPATAAELDVTFRGPPANRDALLEAARALGFRPAPEPT